MQIFRRFSSREPYINFAQCGPYKFDLELSIVNLFWIRVQGLGQPFIENSNRCGYFESFREVKISGAPNESYESF